MDGRTARLLQFVDDLWYVLTFQTSFVLQLQGSDISYAIDVVAFLIILFSTRRPRMSRYPGMPSVLDTIVRDATYYFLLIFSLHILSFLFFFATPVSTTQASREQRSCCVNRVCIIRWMSSSPPGCMFLLITMALNTTNLDLYSPARTRSSPQLWRPASCSL